METPTLNFRCLAYQEKDNSFTGVCLDLDIIEEEHETLQEAILSINDAINSHLEAAAEDNFPPESLRRPAPQKYWLKLKNFITSGSVNAQEERVPTKLGCRNVTDGHTM